MKGTAPLVRHLASSSEEQGNADYFEELIFYIIKVLRGMLVLRHIADSKKTKTKKEWRKEKEKKKNRRVLQRLFRS